MASKLTNSVENESLTEQVPENPLDDCLIAACRAGDRNAQERLYGLLHARVYRLMVRMVGLQDAGDVMQLVFLKVFDKIDQFEGHARFETWVYRVAVNEALTVSAKR